MFEFTEEQYKKICKENEDLQDFAGLEHFKTYGEKVVMQEYNNFLKY